MKSNVSLLRRFGSMIYDLMMVFSLAFSVGLVLAAFFEEQLQAGDIRISFAYLGTIYFYFAWSWVKGGQTLGMRAWKFHVKQEDGKYITHSQAFLRFSLSLMSFLIVGLGYVYQLFDASNLALNDKFSNTYLTKDE